MDADADAPRHLWIIGPGRLGLALGLALRRARPELRLTFSGRAPSPPDHPLFAGPQPAAYHSDLHPPADPPDAVLLTVADTQIQLVAAALACAVPALHAPVLHCSGALDAQVLAPVAALGCPTGSLHPLVAVADPLRDADRLVGAWFGVEEASGRAAALRLVAALGGQELAVARGGKAVYHAAAVFASNHLVGVLAVAERLAAEAGIEPAAGRAALAALARGALESVARSGPAAALTGPLVRGDAATLQLHLARLSPPDAELYSVLARSLLPLARDRGLEEHLVRQVERTLADSP